MNNYDYTRKFETPAGKETQFEVNGTYNKNNKGAKTEKEKKINAISQERLLFLQNLEASKQEISSQIKLLKNSKRQLSSQIKKIEAKIGQLENSNDEKYTPQLAKLHQARDLLDNNKIELKEQIAEAKELKSSIVEDLAIAEAEANIEENKSSIENEKENLEKQKEKIEIEKEEKAEEYEVNEQSYGDIEETAKAEKINWIEEAEKNFQHAHIMMGGKIQQLLTPQNEEELQAYQKLFESGKVFFADPEKGSVRAPENLASQFKKGDKLSLPSGEMTVKDVYVMSDEEYAEFKSAFANHAHTLFLQQKYSPKEPEEEKVGFRSPRTEQPRNRPVNLKHESKDDDDVKKAKTNKALEFFTHFNSEKQIKKEINRLQAEKEKLKKRREILQDFIKEWEKKDANLQFDVKSNVILSEFIKGERLKKDELIRQTKNEITDVETKLVDVTSGIKQLTKIRIQRIKNLKRTSI